jgi:hypothetical protein
MAVVTGARRGGAERGVGQRSGGSHNRHLLSGLVVAQIALSLALLVSSAVSAHTAQYRACESGV